MLKHLKQMNSLVKIRTDAQQNGEEEFLHCVVAKHFWTTESYFTSRTGVSQMY